MLTFRPSPPQLHLSVRQSRSAAKTLFWELRGGNLLMGFRVPAAEETELGKAHHAQGSHSGERDTDTILPKRQHLTSYLHIPFWVL